MEQSVLLHGLENRGKAKYVTWGTPWGRGKVSPSDSFKAKAENGDNLELQTTNTAFWPDGSLKWMTCTAPHYSGKIELKVSSKKEEPSSFFIEDKDYFLVDTGKIKCKIAKKGNVIWEQGSTENGTRIEQAELCLLIENRDDNKKEDVPYKGVVESVHVEESGALRATFCLSGIHISQNDKKAFPFYLRATFEKNSSKIGLVHTFGYDLDEDKDFLKGVGIKLKVPMSGELHNRWLRFGTDNGYFTDSLKLLSSWQPRIPREIYQKQLMGAPVNIDCEEHPKIAERINQFPVWSNYRFSQNASNSFTIKKGTGKKNCGLVSCLEGEKAKGTLAAGDERGGVIVGYRDFWQKYPSALWVDDMETDAANMTIWFWSPDSQPMDFRHYDNTSYFETYYEGFNEFGATPYGITCSSQCNIYLYDNDFPTEEKLGEITLETQKPPLYIAEPEHYYESKVLGDWGLTSRNTSVENWLEDQLDLALDFYIKEVQQRRWYGQFNYGDFMHTYDPDRHVWKYDMGGYAWQNTELVPTYWLWYSFLRGGREDVFTLAEAMTRHCSEVDVYHFGKYKGLGSRHNVNHWGCPCKEARIAMAGHNRFYAYLTGDLRTFQIMDEVLSADITAETMDPLRHFYDKAEMKLPTHVRTGPDWSAFCSNWMVQWERYGDKKILEKLIVGIEDIKKSPLRLISGSDYEYDPSTGHLGYIGEKTQGGSHLSLCMGSTQVWIELADLLEDKAWKNMVAEYGRFYHLPHAKQFEVSSGIIGDRTFTFPYMAAGIGLFAADYYNDKELADNIWRLLIAELAENNKNGFMAEVVKNKGNRDNLEEISWISTNFVAQWCLNVITGLAFGRESLPKELFKEEK